MIPTDVTKAAERLRRNANGEWVVDIYDGNPDDARTAWTCDLVKLRDHCLPWLDPTPIDAAWLQSIGFGAEAMNGWPILLPTDSGFVVELFIDHDGCISLLQGGGEHDDHVTLTSTRFITRGQLLMLLTALGVTCKT